MKNLKNLFLITIFAVITSCSSSDNEPVSANITVSGTLDPSALITLLGTDATALVTLDGQAAASQTTEATINDEISYRINSTVANVEIVITDFFYVSGNRDLWDNGIEVAINTQANPRVANLKIIGGAVGDEVKFGFTFALQTNGIIDLNTTYTVDPKIKIRS